MRAAHLTVSRRAHHQSQSLNFPDSSLTNLGLVLWALIRDWAAMPFSRECAEDKRVQPGSSSWWGVLLEPNTDPATSETHPFKCALLCGHTYTLQGANATKVANQVPKGRHRPAKLEAKATTIELPIVLGRSWASTSLR